MIPEQTQDEKDGDDVNAIVSSAVYGYRRGEEFPVSLSIPHVPDGWTVRFSTRVHADGGRRAVLEVIDNVTEPDPTKLPDGKRWWKEVMWRVDEDAKFVEHVRDHFVPALIAHAQYLIEKRADVAREWASRIRAASATEAKS